VHWEPAADLVALSGSLFFSRNRRLAEDFERYATTVVAIPGSEQLNVDTEVTRERLRASRFWRVSRNM
jgi:hypothetical protein